MSIYGICALFVVGLALAMADHKPPTLPGKCPDVTPFASLDTSKITGDWYIIQFGKQGSAVTMRPSSDTKKCLKKTIIVSADKGLTSTTSFSSASKNLTITSAASPVADKAGVYTVTTDSDDKSATITILDTDYTNYLVGVFCKQDGDFHLFKVEILSRQKTLDSSLEDKAKAALDAAKISADLKDVDQSC